ncbi:hypothetical protein D3C80_1896010 [compost metagenome]
MAFLAIGERVRPAWQTMALSTRSMSGNSAGCRRLLRSTIAPLRRSSSSQARQVSSRASLASVVSRSSFRSLQLSASGIGTSAGRPSTARSRSGSDSLKITELQGYSAIC